MHALVYVTVVHAALSSRQRALDCMHLASESSMEACFRMTALCHDTDDIREELVLLGSVSTFVPFHVHVMSLFLAHVVLLSDTCQKMACWCLCRWCYEVSLQTQCKNFCLQRAAHNTTIPQGPRCIIGLLQCISVLQCTSSRQTCISCVKDPFCICLVNVNAGQADESKRHSV